MIHKHFSTSRKHGAVYDIEDLMAVAPVNDDLRGFITRWDAVIAGMTSEPDVMWRQACFHNAVKNFKPLSHDLAVNDRTTEGEPTRSYEFLMKVARDYLERKRLEKMRQATKKSLQERRMQLQHLLGLHRLEKVLGFAMIFKQESALEAKIVSISKKTKSTSRMYRNALERTRKPRKAKVEVRKISQDPIQEAQVDQCLLGLGIKCASSGRPGNVTEEVNVLSSIRQNLQLRLPRTTSVEEQEEEEEERRRRVTGPGHPVGDLAPRKACSV